MPQLLVEAKSKILKDANISSKSTLGPDSPIGIFDSGVGGLSVLKQIARNLSAESILYYGDTAHVPYGGRPLSEVRGFALSICTYLVEQGAKMIVMACNMSSAVAIDEARVRFPNIPILGVIEPGSASAIATGATRIGVLATQGTVSSGAYTRAITRLQPAAQIHEIACPQFVPLVEAEMVDSDEALSAAADYLAPLAKFQSTAIILGCTHYPFLLDTLVAVSDRLFTPTTQPSFIDPAVETASAVATILSERGLKNRSAQSGTHKYFVSGSPDHFQQNGSFFLGRPLNNVHHASLD